MTMPIFVLSLPEAEERRAPLCAALARLGLDATLVPGLTPAEIPEADWARYDRRRCLGVYGVEMVPGEIACFLAHERVVQRVVDEGHALALILEDDALIEPSLPAALHALEQQATAGAPPWDIVRLATMRPKALKRAIARQKPLATFGKAGEEAGLYRLNTHVLGLQGYVLTLAGAQRMLAALRRIFMPVDQTIDRFWENGIEPYVVYPFPVGHGEGPSLIGDRNPARRYQQGKGVLWRRRINRWRDGLAKRAFLLARRWPPLAR